MQWIEYDYVCNEKNNIKLHKKVEYNVENLAIAQQEACDGQYTITEDGEEITVKPMPVEFGGTGAKTKAMARANLNVVCKSGDTMTGTLTFRGIILTEGVDYGTLEQRPAPGTKGRLYFQKINS